MSNSLPERPDLDQLRRQAKELRDAARRGDQAAAERISRHHPSAKVGPVSLAVVQLVIARELGFSSWPTLKAAVDAERRVPDDRARQLVAASIEGRLAEAVRLLRADPGIAERSWPPLLYACYSRWHHIDDERAVGLAQVVGLLIDAGASPHTNNGAFRNGYRSALRGAVEVNNPAVVKVLLEAGANPDDGRCIEQAADRRDPRCLELLLARRARVVGTWALGAAVYADAPEVVSQLLDGLRADTADTAREATNALADAAAANAGYAVVEALLSAGADPNVTDSDAGRSALRCAVRAGHDDTADLLLRAGATDDSTEVDQFIGACLAGDRRRAERLIAENPGLHDQMTEADRTVIVEAAGRSSAATIALLLDLGFSPHARNGFGEQPLHNAAYHGNAPVVRALLDAGADVDGRDDRFDATPLA